jgi:hypothetical protein
MDVTGEIVMKGDTVQVTETFRKREFVIEVIGNKPEYPEYPKFELKQDKCALLDKYAVGQKVQVSFDLCGRKYNDRNTGEEKYFNSLHAWRLSTSNIAPEYEQQPAPQAPQPGPQPQTAMGETAPGEIPF